MPRRPAIHTSTKALDDEPLVSAIMQEVRLLRHSTPPSMWSKSIIRLFKLYDAYEESKRAAEVEGRPRAKRRGT